MTMPAVDATGTSTGSTSSSSSGGGLSSNEVSQLSNPQMFLQMLIAELQNQDPTNPMDPSTILQQTSELSNVEAINQMTTAMSSEQASGMLGRTVTANVSGSVVSGTVTAINLAAGSSPTLTISGQQTPVDISAITQVA